MPPILSARSSAGQSNSLLSYGPQVQLLPCAQSFLAHSVPFLKYLQRSPIMSISITWIRLKVTNGSMLVYNPNTYVKVRVRVTQSDIDTYGCNAVQGVFR